MLHLLTDPVLHWNSPELDTGLDMYRGRVYVLDNPQLCHDLVHAHHGAAVTGPPDNGKCWNWCHRTTGGQGCPDVARFIIGCDVCNWTKTFPMQKVGKLIPNKVPD